MAWGDEGLALLYESWYKTRRSVVWAFAPGDPPDQKRVLFDRNYEDAYTDPGCALERGRGWGCTRSGLRHAKCICTHAHVAGQC